MRMPNAERAYVDRAKLRDYCLNRDHPRGRHKARVFESALGLTDQHVDLLRDTLLFIARSVDAQPSSRDIHGERYVLDFPMTVGANHARVRSAWMIRSGEDYPRLTSCYVL